MVGGLELDLYGLCQCKPLYDSVILWLWSMVTIQSLTTSHRKIWEANHGENASLNGLSQFYKSMICLRPEMGIFISLPKILLLLVNILILDDHFFFPRHVNISLPSKTCSTLTFNSILRHCWKLKPCYKEQENVLVFQSKLATFEFIK